MLSVVVPATDVPVTLERCVAAIRAAGDVPREIVVVDGPRDLTVSEARNEGVLRASGDVVVFVDADVEVHADTFTRIRAAYEADPSLVALFGSYDDAPTAPGVVSRFRNLLHHHVHHEHGGPATTFWSGLGAVRRDAFLAVGGFDRDRYARPSIEDIDLGDRLHRAGANTVLDPSIQGTHLKRWTLRSMVTTDFARRGVPWVALQVRTGRAATGLNLGWRHRASALATVVLVAAVAWLPLVSIVALAALVGLNRGLYTLLVDRLGPFGAAAGVGLHILHILVAVASLPVGVAVGLRQRMVSGRDGLAPLTAGVGPE